MTNAIALTEATGDGTGLGAIDRGGRRVSVDDKAMINCRADVNLTRSSLSSSSITGPRIR